MRRRRQHSCNNNSSASLWPLTCLLLLPGCLAFNAEITTRNAEIRQGRTSGEEFQYIEVPIGSDFDVECSAGTFGAKWELPDGVDASKNKRIQVESDDFVSTLRFSGIQEQDVGSYSCVPSVNEHAFREIHIFVDGSDFAFVPQQKGLGAMRTTEFRPFELPCPSTAYFDEEERRNHFKVTYLSNQEALDIDYDPRSGFDIEVTSLSDSAWTNHNGISMNCVYNGPRDFPKRERNTIVYFIGDDNPGEDKVTIEQKTEWPHVGGPLRLICKKPTESPYKYDVKFECPGCDDTTRVKQFHNKTGGGIHFELQIARLQVSDSGHYTCDMKHEDGERSGASRMVEVSPKRGQIRVKSRTPPVLRLSTNRSENISISFNHFPENTLNYSSKWLRRYRMAGQNEDIVEAIVNSDNAEVTSKPAQCGSASSCEESLRLTNLTPDRSGSYTLYVQVEDLVMTFEWEVLVDNPTLKPQIRIVADSVTVRQTFYTVGTDVEVHCIVDALPPVKLTLEHSTIGSGIWRTADDSTVRHLEGTFQSGLSWTFRAENDVELRCTAAKGKETTTIERTVRVTSTKLGTSRRVRKPPAADQLDEKTDDVFEGDSVELRCQTPPLGKGEHVNWTHGSSVLPTRRENKPHETVFVATLDNVRKSHDGEYVCSVEGNRLGLELKVIGVKAPHLVSGMAEEHVSLPFDTEQTLECGIAGTPQPVYQWFKNGQLRGERQSALTIPRVIGEDEGEYKCAARNRAGTAEQKFVLKVTGAPESKRTGATWLWLLLVLIFALAMLAFAVLWMRQRRKSQLMKVSLSKLYHQLLTRVPESDAHRKIPLDRRVDNIYYNRDTFELDRKNLKLGRILGAGHFGSVHEATLTKPSATHRGNLAQNSLHVAVKVPKTETETPTIRNFKALSDELKILQAIGQHPNVLALIGAVTKQIPKGELFVVVEYCAFGDLRTFLVHHDRAQFIDEVSTSKPQQSDDGYLKPEQSVYMSENTPSLAVDLDRKRLLDTDASQLTTSDLLAFSCQIANGMHYIASKPCIHRDLAARNIFLTDKRIVRIGDFGLARTDRDNYNTQNRDMPMPYKWMARESYDSLEFTLATDVWSFGVVLWELFSLGDDPYPGMDYDKVRNMIDEGRRMERPSAAPPAIYKIMLNCWRTAPAERPPFAELKEVLFKQLQFASPPLASRLDADLDEELNRIRRYGEWRQHHNPSSRATSPTYANTPQNHGGDGGESYAMDDVLLPGPSTSPPGSRTQQQQQQQQPGHYL